MSESLKQAADVATQDPALDDDVVFVSYNPSKSLNRQNRKTINSFLGSVKRRRSRKTQLGQDRRVEDSKATTKATGRLPAPHVYTSLLRRDGRGLQHLNFGSFLGGLRTDPFDSYPIRARNPVTNAVDVYCQVWAPTHIGQYSEDRENNLLLSELFPLALQHVDLFESLVAWAQCFSLTYYKRDSFPMKEVLRHRGNAIAALRTQLLSPSNFSIDAAIITTLFLMGLDYLMGDVAAFETLLQGIYQLVDHCGGLDKLGLRGLTKAMVLRIEKEWTMRRNQKSRYTDTKPTQCLEYPTHPFGSDLCSVIAKMPKGFRDLALESVLSIQMLSILERMSDWHTSRDRVNQQVATPEDMSFLKNYDAQFEAQETYRCLEICMGSGGGKGIERCLYYGLIAYILESFAQTEFSPELYWVMQDFPLALEQTEPEPTETDCLTWISVVAASSSKGPLSESGVRIMGELLKDHAHLRNWDRLEETMRRFFWHDSLAVEWKRSWNAATERQCTAGEAFPKGSTVMDLPLMTPPRSA